MSAPDGIAEPKLGVLGTGRMGVRLAAMFAGAGHSVVLGSRTPDRAAKIVSDLAIPGLSGGSYADAMRAQAILPAVFMRDGLFDLLEPFAVDIAGKLLIDISNPFNADYSDFLTPWDSSGAEELHKRFPQARIVGAFKHVFSEVFDAPVFDGILSDVLIVGDDDEAKLQFARLSQGTPFRYLDAGPLRNARTVERLTMITGALGRSLGSYPRMNWRLLGEEVAQ